MVAPTGREGAARRAGRSAGVLVLAAIAAFALVAVVHEATRGRIEAQARARLLERYDAVLQGRRYDNDLLADALQVRDPDLLGTTQPVAVHRARLRGEPVAVVIEPVAPNGWSGPIGLLVGIAPDGTLLGVRVTTHHESPGLGDAIDRDKSDWIDRFAGRSLRDPSPERWKIRKDGGDFDQFTGATVTPRAVVGAVANVLAYFERHREELLAPPATIAP